MSDYFNYLTLRILSCTAIAAYLNYYFTACNRSYFVFLRYE